jgi:3,4-dihydroxy 2-butanone 4-phosphate synthase/GTP cyclohydrolase II
MNSKTVERVAEARLPTDFGELHIIGYRSLNSNEEFVVLVHGELWQDQPSLVRIHSLLPTMRGNLGPLGRE